MAKEDELTSIANINHLMGYVNLIAVVQTIDCDLVRKKLASVCLAVKDESIKETFNVKLALPSADLDKLMQTCKQGYVIYVKDLKVVKNDGFTYGLVSDEEEIILYDEKGCWVKWYTEESKPSVSGKILKKITSLIKWGETCPNGSSESKSKRQKVEDLTSISQQGKLMKNNSIKGSSSKSESSKGTANDDEIKSRTDVKNKHTGRFSTPIEMTKEKTPLVKRNDLSRSCSKLLSDEISLNLRKTRSLAEIPKMSKNTKEDTEEGKDEPPIRQTRAKKNLDFSVHGKGNRNPSPKSLQKNQSKRDTLDGDKDINNRSLDSSSSSLVKCDLKPLGSSRKSKLNTTIDEEFKESVNNLKRTRSSSSLKKESKLSHKVEKNELPEPVNDSLSKTGSDTSLKTTRNISKLPETGETPNKDARNSERGLQKKQTRSTLNSGITVVDETIKGSIIDEQPSKPNKTPRKLEPLAKSSKSTLGVSSSPKFLDRKRFLNSSDSSLTSSSNSVSPTRSVSPKNISNKLLLTPKIKKDIRTKKSGTDKKKPMTKTQLENPQTKKNLEKNENKTVKILPDQGNKSNEKVQKTPSKLTKQTRSKISHKRSTDHENERLEESDFDDAEEISKVDSNKSTTTDEMDISSSIFCSSFKHVEDDITSPDSTKKLKQTRRSQLQEKQSVANYEELLRPFTKVVFLKNVTEFSECSYDNLEDVSIPEKFNINCKVFSSFSLVEEDIQVIRVGDGHTSKKPLLVIPKSSSWSELVHSVINNTQVEDEPSFIDVIIFNASRLDRPIVTDKYYRLKNLNLVKFLLVHDSRKIPKRNEMFCFGEGQNIYPANSSPKMRQEIENRLQAQSSNNTNDDELSDPKTNDKGDIEVLKDQKGQKRKFAQLESSTLTSKDAIEKRKRLSEEQISQMVGGDSTTGDKCFPITNDMLIGDETMMEETPAEVKELKAILVEESANVVLQTESEINHLKNSGSEITFSQFCKGVNARSDKEQTSTQVCSLSEDVLEYPEKKSSLSEDKMEPLIYSPSTSSKSSELARSSRNKPEDCSESVLPKLDKDKPPKQKTKIKEVFGTISVQTTHSTSTVTEESGHQKSASPSIISSHSSNDDMQVTEIIERYKSSQETHFKQKLEENQPPNVESRHRLRSEIINQVSLSRNDEIPSEINCKSCAIRQSNLPLQEEVPKTLSMKTNVLEIIKNLPEKFFFTSKRNDTLHFQEEPIDQQRNCFSYCMKKGPFVTFNMVKQIMANEFFTIPAKIVSLNPSSTDSWKTEGIKSKCPECQKMFSVDQLNSTQSQTPLSIGTHLVCPDSECGHQLLENPEFQFEVTIQPSSSLQTTVHIKGHHAVKFFGCTAEQALSEDNHWSHVTKLLQDINDKIRSSEVVQINLTRVDVCDPKSGPLFLLKIFS